MPANSPHQSQCHLLAARGAGRAHLDPLFGLSCIIARQGNNSCEKAFSENGLQPLLAPHHGVLTPHYLNQCQDLSAQLPGKPMRVVRAVLVAASAFLAQVSFLRILIR